ncbi:MAG TPA: glycosyltransferase family 39 protein [Blastocatellia bacterium]|nr:glycosyltransferase family 39 protein [Blastocatellia bacterium]
MNSSTLIRLKRARRTLLRALGAGFRPSRKTKIILGLLIFLVSFATKSLMAVDLAPSIYTSAQASGRSEFERDATSITEGKGLLVPDGWDPSDTSLLFHAPGYSVLLSGVYSLFGRSRFTVQLVHNLINSASAVLLFLIAGTLLTWPVGAVAGLLTSVSHHLSYYSNFLLPDSLSALPILIAVYLLARFRRGRTRAVWLYGLVGLMLGLSVWLRPNALLLGLFFSIFVAAVFANGWGELKRSWVIAAVSLLAVTPITIRNYIIYGEFVPVSANLGIVLWEGIGDESGDRFGAVTTDQAVAEQEAQWYGDPRYGASWVSPDGIKRDRDRINRSLDVIASNPVWFAGTMAKRMGGMFKYSAHAPLVYKECERQDAPPPETKAHAQGAAADRTALEVGNSICWMRPAVRAVQRVAKETVLLFIIIGAVIVFTLSRRRALLLLIVPIYFLIFQSIVHLEFRYTIPIHYFLFIFAAAGWVATATAVYTWAGRFTQKKS